MDAISSSQSLPPPSQVAPKSTSGTDHTITFKDAFKFWTNGHYEAAQTSYEQILHSDPENKEARYLSGLLKKGIVNPMEYFDMLHHKQSIPPTLAGHMLWASHTVPVYEKLPWHDEKEALEEEALTIALMFLEGSGLEHNDEQATRFLLVAGDKGNQKLREMYLQGRCITKDTMQKAISHLHLILHSGEAVNPPFTAFLLGKTFLESGSWSNGLNYLDMAVKAGFSGASDLREKALLS